MTIAAARLGQYRRSFDRDASAYCGRLNAAGASVSIAQKRLISDFIYVEKLAGRWASTERLYLPIWGVAAANAICIKSGISGTWVGSVSHGAGYVSGDTATGHLDPGGNAAFFGLSTGNASIGYGIWKEDSRHALGTSVTYAGVNNAISIAADPTVSNTQRIVSLRSPSGPNRAIVSRGATPISGVVIGTNTSATSRYACLRRDAEFASAANTTSDPNAMGATDLRFLNASDAEAFMFYLGTAISNGDASALALALETLCKNLTGKSYTI